MRPSQRIGGNVLQTGSHTQSRPESYPSINILFSPQPYQEMPTLSPLKPLPLQLRHDYALQRTLNERIFGRKDPTSPHNHNHHATVQARCDPASNHFAAAGFNKQQLKLHASPQSAIFATRFTPNTTFDGSLYFFP